MSEQYEFELSLYEFLTFVHTERERVIGFRKEETFGVIGS